MAAISNRDLRISIVTFYNLNHSKGKNYTLKHFSSQIRAKIVSQSQIYRWPKTMKRGRHDNIQFLPEYTLTQL